MNIPPLTGRRVVDELASPNATGVLPVKVGPPGCISQEGVLGARGGALHDHDRVPRAVDIAVAGSQHKKVSGLCVGDARQLLEMAAWQVRESLVPAPFLQTQVQPRLLRVIIACRKGVNERELDITGAVDPDAKLALHATNQLPIGQGGVFLA
jgi:hypothetical protein